METPLLQLAGTLRDMGRRQNSVHSNLKTHMDGIGALITRLQWQISKRKEIQAHIDSYVNTNKPIPNELREKYQEFERHELSDQHVVDRLKELSVNLLIQYKVTISLVNDTQAAAKQAAMYSEPEAREVAKVESAFPFARGAGLTEDSTKASPQQAQAVQERVDAIESLSVDPPRYD